MQQHQVLTRLAGYSFLQGPSLDTPAEPWPTGSGWLAAKSVSQREIWVHLKRMCMSSLWLSQQLRVLSTCRHLWLPLIKVWVWICASVPDERMTSVHEFMSTQGREVNVSLTMSYLQLISWNRSTRISLRSSGFLILAFFFYSTFLNTQTSLGALPCDTRENAWQPKH